MKFKPSKPFTVGIELEVQLVDSETFELTEKSDIVFDELSEDFRRRVHPEFFKSMVEVVTSPYASPSEAVGSVRHILREIKRIGDRNGFKVIALGTHPFADPSSVAVTQNERYERLLKEFQVILKNFLIYGLHIHVGIPDENLAIKAYNLTINYLPLFLAISTSSPFFAGRFTGLHSFRTKIFEMLPRAGIPEYLHSYEQFVELIDILKESKTIESLKDVWWDVRLRPDFGTLELRVCDSIPQMERIEALAILFQALCMFSEVSGFERQFLEVLKQNKWNATRHSFRGRFIAGMETKEIQKAGIDLLRSMEEKGIFQELGTSSKIVENFIFGKPVSGFMIDMFCKGKSLRDIAEIGELKL